MLGWYGIRLHEQGSIKEGRGSRFVGRCAPRKTHEKAGAEYSSVANAREVEPGGTGQHVGSSDYSLIRFDPGHELMAPPGCKGEAIKVEEK